MKSMLKSVLLFAGAVIVLALPVRAGSAQPVTGVPEPSSLLFLASGLGAVGVLRYYRLRRR